MGERGIVLRVESQKIGDQNNGNFLGLIELLSHWDPILHEHVDKVRESQEKYTRLQVHYLSADSQNEFISQCSELVLKHIILQREQAKYFSIMVDATPVSAHVEQTTYILRYLEKRWSTYDIAERFLTFVDCLVKTGAGKVLTTDQTRLVSTKAFRPVFWNKTTSLYVHHVVAIH